MPNTVPVSNYFSSTTGSTPDSAYPVGALGAAVQEFSSRFGAAGTFVTPYNFYQVTFASTSTLTVSIALDAPIVDGGTFLLYKGPVAPGQPIGSGIAIMTAGDTLVTPITGQPYAYDDTNGTATVSVVLPAGTYYVKANNPAQGSPGGDTYTIDMAATQAGSATQDLAGNDPTSARPVGTLLATPQIFTDYAGPGDGYDFYSFTVASSSTATIQFTADTPAGVHPGTSGIALYGADGTTLVGSDLVAASGTASISQALAAGTYYLKVDVSSGYAGYNGTDYHLSFKAGSAAGTTTTPSAPSGTVTGGGISQGIGAGATLRFVDTSLEAQAGRLYQAAFGRAADDAGLAYWSAALHGGTSLVDVAAAFVASPEFQARHGSGQSSAAFVTDLYQTVLHRAPDPAGLAYWQGAIDGGTATRAQVLASLSESPENTAGTPPSRDAQQAARLYYAELGRAPDAAGLTFWTSQLSNGTATLGQEADALAGSPEFISHYGTLGNAAFVGQLYQNVLGRAADPVGLASWTQALASGASHGAVVVGFSESAEAQARFASVIGQNGIQVS